MDKGSFGGLLRQLRQQRKLTLPQLAAVPAAEQGRPVVRDFAARLALPTHGSA